MRFTILSSLLILMNVSIFAQDLFKKGLDYFEKGEYSYADSIFRQLLKQSPSDIDLLYNYGTTRLYMGDTCKFCSIMSQLSNYYQEPDAYNLYSKMCGTIEDLYYDKNLHKCTEKEARYIETVVTDKKEDFKTVYVHDKKRKNASVIINGDIMNSIKTDVIARYRLYADSSRLFLFTLTPPEYQGEGFNHTDYIKNNQYVKECKEKLNLNKIIVTVEYVVSKMGIIKDIQITGIMTSNDELKYKSDISDLYKSTTINDMETLKKYIALIVGGMPRRNPGKFRNENVDCLATDIIYFW